MTTAPQRGVLASFALLLISMLSAQALAFDVGGLSYAVTSATDVEVTGREGRDTENAATNIVIPDTVMDSGTTYSVTSIAEGAFRDNALTSVIIGNSVTSIAEEAFRDNALTSVTIPDSVTTIGESAFRTNFTLTSVIIGNSVTTIGESAFRDNATTSVIIGNSVTTIGDNAFGGNALTSVIIPDSVTSIGAWAFEGNALTSVIIPDSVTSIGNNAFYDCNLTSMVIPDSVTSIGESAFEGNALTSVIIGNSVTTIGEFAFAFNALASVTIGNGVTTIGQNAFYENALASVTIPSSVTTIEATAFSDNALTSAHFGGNFEQTLKGAAMFRGNPNLTTITYCEGTTGWPQDFSNGSTTITATSIVCSSPDAPTIDSITPGAGQLTVAFTPGIDNGSPAYSYEASCLGVGVLLRVNVVGPTSPIIVYGLYDGDTYDCFVTATNIIGTSPASATSEPFVVGAPATVVPPVYGAPPTPPSSATPVPTSPIWLLGIMAGLLSLVGISKLRKA